MEESPYTPLNPELREIRLLEIALGSHDDELVISLRIKRLNRKRPKFNALSYAWGREKSSRKATLNGRTVFIRPNLDGALRQLRRSMSGHLLWIDALRIKQDDIDERSQQVRMMGDVFSSAERVIIWLGLEQKNDQYVVDMIKRRHIPVEADEAVTLIKVLKRICWRPWFGRLWVAQELALAKQTPLLRLGSRTVLWDDFHRYVTTVRDETEVRDKANEWPYWSCNAMQTAFWRVSDLHNIRRNKDLNIALQLDSASRLQATDLRDLIYGLLGICTFPPRQPQIAVDYRKSVRQVFLEISACMLLGRTLPYRWFPLHAPRVKALKFALPSMHLPSWAFDLSITS